MQRYRNLRGSTGDACECSSWIKHYEIGTQDETVPYVCSDLGCTADEQLVGAHVLWSDDNGKPQAGVFIIPLCKHHNRAEAFMWRKVKPGTLFIGTDRSVCRGGVEGRQALKRAQAGLRRPEEDAFRRALAGSGHQPSVVHSARSSGGSSYDPWFAALSGRPVTFEPDPWAKPAKTCDEYMADQSYGDESVLLEGFGGRLVKK